MENCPCAETSLKTEIGILEILYCENGVHSIHIVPHDDPRYSNNENFQDTLNSEVEHEGNVLKSVIIWLKSYFLPSIEIIKTPPVCASVFNGKGEFTVRVWKTLMTKVAFGQTISYGQLAALCGNNAASRAVGSAMRNNCIPLIIPCHRVIKSDGKIGHFSGGKNVKEWLLKHEKASFTT